MKNIMKDSYREKLKGRLFGALCEKEKADGGNWDRCIESVQIELAGMAENDDQQSINLYSLIGLLAMLKYFNYEYFRKTIFRCMDLIDKIDQG